MSCNDCPHSYGVCSERLHEGSVETTLCAVDQRVIWSELVGDTCKWCVSECASQIPNFRVIPLMKNWFPSLVKNLEPLVVMVAIAETEDARAAMARGMLARMFACVKRSRPADGLLLV